MAQTGSQTAKQENRKLEISYQIPGPDFTTYKELEFKENLPRPKGKGAKKKELFSHACTLFIEDTEKPAVEGEAGKKAPLEARALACLAYKGRFWSVTLRSGADNNRPAPPKEALPIKLAARPKFWGVQRATPQYQELILTFWAKLPEEAYYKAVSAGLRGYIKKKSPPEPEPQPYAEVKFKDFLGYCPPGHPRFLESVQNPAPSLPAENKGNFLNDIHKICHVLYHILFESAGASSHPSGLIAVTGATDSSKSYITRGLIFLYLFHAAQEARMKQIRKPHLVTFEDPIERYYINDPLQKSAPAAPEDLEQLLDALYLDYTPREKEADADNLLDVTRDALRQTPAVLFVGETREKEDWKALLEFAGSGHLVITTSHASSVVEAMSGIFRATDTKLPAQRSEIARRIMGIINLRGFTPPGTTLRALLPAIWHRTPQSVNNLIADGLASILPNSGTGGRDSENGCYGRKFFADKLIAESEFAQILIGKHKAGEKGATEPLEDIVKKAIEWDLRGV